MATILNPVAEAAYSPLRQRTPVAELVGFEVQAIEEGQAVILLEAGPQHANPMGTVHGGILCDIADAAMGMAYASRLAPGESFTTLELKINFLRPVRTGTLLATGTVVQAGKTVGLVECDVVNEAGRLVARATSTCMTLRGDQAAGRRPGDARMPDERGA